MRSRGGSPGRTTEVHTRKNWQIIVLVLAVAALAAGIGAYAATSAGTQSDPLISMSYLNDVLEPSIRSSYTSRIAAEARELEESLENSLSDAAGAFEAVSLAEGESVQCSAGAQLLFRSGSAAATGELADLTTGESLAAGSALTANHLYLAAEGCEIIASSASSLMLR